MILKDGKMKMEIDVAFISGDCRNCDAEDKYMEDTLGYIVTLHRGEIFLMEEDAEVSKSEWIDALYGIREVACGHKSAFLHEFENNGLLIVATRIGDKVRLEFRQEEWMGLGSSYMSVCQVFTADEAIAFIDDELNSYDCVLCTKVGKCGEGD